MEAERISILMPVKNAEPFLTDCVASIVNQDEPKWELIAVDDNSSDSSYDILDGFSKSDSRISVKRNTGNGILDALRLAYGNSKGTLITRMDADDKMVSNKLRILKDKLLLSGPGNVAIGKVKYFSESALGEGYKRYQNWLNNLTETGSNYNDLYKECVIPSPCWMVFRKDLEKCDAFDTDVYPEDYDLCFRFYREGLKVLPCREVLHFWRDHSNRSSRTDENYADNRFLELKVNWFLQLNRNPEKELVLWGAGKKGKSIAKLFLERQIDFRWICNNPNKIGRFIFDVKMESTEVLSTIINPQIIVTVANPIEQETIRQYIEKGGYWFC